MGRTALYRDHLPWRPPRAAVQLDADAVTLAMPDGRRRRLHLHGVEPMAMDGCIQPHCPVAQPEDEVASWRPGATPAPRAERRFVRMLVLERPARMAGRGLSAPAVIVTPPDEGALAPNVVRVPAAPIDAAIIDASVWESVADWVLGGGRLAGFPIPGLARLAAIASPQFAVLIGEVAAQRALEIVAEVRGPLRGIADFATALLPLTMAARTSPRAGEALIAALAYVAGASRRRRRWRGAW